MLAKRFSVAHPDYMTKLDAQELRLIAHHGFSCRLEDVIASTLGYQTARATFQRATEDYRTHSTTVEVAHDLRDQLPQAAALIKTAEQQQRDAERMLSNAQAALASKTEIFFEAAGAASDLLVAAMDQNDWQLTRPRVMELLQDAVRTY
jgi:hypothetical protein